MRLKILVEGDTEQKFVKTMLCPYLQQHWDAIIPVKIGQAPFSPEG